MITFTDNVSARLRRLATTSPAAALGEELLAGAQAIVEDAQHTIHDGAVSGARHVPSRPGEAPNNDTGELADSIHIREVIETTDRVQTSVIVDAKYGGYLELGTSRIMPRPFLSPATKRQHDAVSGGVLEAKRRHEAG